MSFSSQQARFPIVDLPDSLGARDGFTQPTFYKRFDSFSL